jgi:AcrR family transcriptional regulator
VRPVTEGPTIEPVSRRSVAVARSVEPAREAAEARVQRFLDAAFELITSPTGEDFTVQNVVDRSGLSLRSFYHHFGGKDELLLAVFEESVRTTAASLRTGIHAIEGPLDRFRYFATEYYRMCRSGRPRNSDKRVPTRAVGQFAHQLLFDHPQEASAAFAPLVAILQQVLADAAAAGAIRSDLDLEQVSGVILQSIMFNSFATTITGSWTDEVPGRGELLWEMLLHGLGPA